MQRKCCFEWASAAFEPFHCHLYTVPTMTGTRFLTATRWKFSVLTRGRIPLQAYHLCWSLLFHIFTLAAEPYFRQSGLLTIKHMKVQFCWKPGCHLKGSAPQRPSLRHPPLTPHLALLPAPPPVSLWQSSKIVFWEKEQDFFPIT